MRGTITEKQGGGVREGENREKTFEEEGEREKVSSTQNLCLS